MRHWRTYAMLAVVALIALAPLLWAVSTAFKPERDVQVYPPQWIPGVPTLENFRTVLVETGFLHQLMNSSLVALLSAVIAVAVAAPAAYSLARFEFRGKRTVAVAILTTSMIPQICLLVPLYFVASKAHLYDTYGVLLLVYCANQVPSMVWFLKAFFEAVPRELDESAAVDGCTRWSAFYRVILPMSRPGLSAAGLLVFIFVWNDFLIAFTLTISESRRMVAVGLYQYLSQYGINWASLMASVVLALVPVLLVFTALQRHFIQGLTAGSVKG